MDKKNISARVVDSLGQPISGAIVYIESFREGRGTFDFTWGISDSNGFAYTTDSKLLSLMCPPDGGFAIALLINDRVKECFFDRKMSKSSYKVVLTPRNDVDEWNHRTELLEFPFEHNRKLYRKLNLDKNRILVGVFCNVYHRVFTGDISLTSGYEYKASVMKQLQNRYFPHQSDSESR